MITFIHILEAGKTNYYGLEVRVVATFGTVVPRMLHHGGLYHGFLVIIYFMFCVQLPSLCGN